MLIYKHNNRFQNIQYYFCKLLIINKRKFKKFRRLQIASKFAAIL